MVEQKSELTLLSDERTTLEILGESISRALGCVNSLARHRRTRREDFRYWSYAAVCYLGAKLGANGDLREIRADGRVIGSGYKCHDPGIR